MDAERQRLVRQLSDSAGLPSGVIIRPWIEADFPSIQRLSRAEGWTTSLDRPRDAIQSWHNSWPALVAVADDAPIGFIRAVTDGSVTTYVAELLVAPEWRGRGVGTVLLGISQRLCEGTRIDLLAIGESRGFYERLSFRRFSGYRRNWLELERRRPN